MYDHESSDPDPNKLARLITENEFYHDGWADYADAVRFFDEFELGDDMYFFTSKLLQLRIEQTAVVNEEDHHLLEGHSWLIRLVSDAVIDQLLAHDIIKRPKIYTEGEYTEREQIARRSYYELGPAIAELLDYSQLHGIDYEIEPKKEHDHKIMHGDPNEGLVHVIGVAYASTYLQQNGYDVSTYYKTDDDEIIDICAFDDGDLSIVAEVETKYDNKDHISNDATKLAQYDADSYWICPTREICNKVLSQLSNANLIYSPSGTSGFPDTLGLDESRNRLQDINKSNRYNTAECENSPVNVIDSYDGIRSRLAEINGEVTATDG